LALASVASPLSVSAQDAEEGTASEQNPEEPAPPTQQAPEEPALEVPDIDTLSQSAIEHYEIQSAQLTEEKKKHERRRRRGLRIGVPIAVAAVVAVVVLGAVGASYARRDFD
jgi:hypothetical protein